MAGKERDLVAEREEFFADGLNELVMVSLRKIGAPDRAIEDHIAYETVGRLAVEEDEMSRGMPWAVQDFQALFPKRDGIGLVEPSIRLEGRAFHAIALRLAGNGLDEELVRGVRPLDWYPKRGGKGRGHPGVVQVSVGDKDFLHRHPCCLDLAEDAIEIPSGVNDGPGVGGGASKQRAVLPEAGNRDDGHFHR